MRPVQFHADRRVTLLRRERRAPSEQLTAALGPAVDRTVFRKLREIPYPTRYSHRGRYDALDAVARFDELGLWTYREVHFSRFGSRVETGARVVREAEQGLCALELGPMVPVDVEEPLLRWVRDERLAREQVAGAYLYCAREPARRRAQILARAAGPPAEPQQRRDRALDQSQAARILRFSLLDARQRRLCAGRESRLRGWGGIDAARR